MPDKTFLETYELYRRFPLELPKVFEELDTPAINMPCWNCKSEQTFTMRGSYTAHLTHPYSMWGSYYLTKGTIVKVDYACAACDWTRVFLIALDPAGEYVEKVGQFPRFDTSIDSRVEKSVGPDDIFLYKNGRMCELHGYGIGAFAYYRRLVENVISKLLDEIVDLVPEEDKEHYMAGLQKVRNEKLAEEKLEVAKDILPQSLKTAGSNPLSTLYDALSAYIHARTDHECLNIAVTIRTVFDALVIQIDANKTSSKALTEGTKRLLLDKSRERHR